MQYLHAKIQLIYVPTADNERRMHMQQQQCVYSVWRNLYIYIQNNVQVLHFITKTKGVELIMQIVQKICTEIKTIANIILLYHFVFENISFCTLTYKIIYNTNNFAHEILIIIKYLQIVCHTTNYKSIITVYLYNITI